VVQVQVQKQSMHLTIWRLMAEGRCRFPQLASTVDFLGSLLGRFSDESGLSPGGVPTDMTLLTADSNPDGSFNGSCLVEQGANYEVQILAHGRQPKRRHGSRDEHSEKLWRVKNPMCSIRGTYRPTTTSAAVNQTPLSGHHIG